MRLDRGTFVGGGTYFENASGAGSFARIEDVEVSGEGERDDIARAAPDVAHLLMLEPGADGPRVDRFAGLDVPWRSYQMRFCGFLGRGDEQSFTSPSRAEVASCLLSGFQVHAIYGERLVRWNSREVSKGRLTMLPSCAFSENSPRVSPVLPS